MLESADRGPVDEAISRQGVVAHLYLDFAGRLEKVDSTLLPILGATFVLLKEQTFLHQTVFPQKISRLNILICRR